MCAFDECDRKAVSLGYCNKHYMFMKRNDPVGLYGVAALCATEGCDVVASERKLCKEHLKELRRNLDAMAGETRHERDKRPIPDDFWEFVKYELNLGV